jgi:hypothetical protein
MKKDKGERKKEKAKEASLTVWQKVRKHRCIHGSIPHHERKIKWLQRRSSVRPEVSKGERDFLRGHHPLSSDF